MISFPKSFTLQFIFYFSVTLILLGIGQALLGTIRLYNPSEQEYEQLSPQKTVSVTPDNTFPPSTTSFLPDKTLPPE